MVAVLLERKAAESDFSNKRINPPIYSLTLQFPAKAISQNFYNYLANALHISEKEAADGFAAFSSNIKQQIISGHSIDWSGVGILSKGLAGEIKFKSVVNELVIEKPVIAEKVIREKAEHMVRVGEDNKTSAEMVEMLNQPEEKKSYWWAYALSLALIGIVFLGWYFSEHGLEVSSTANTATLTQQEAGSSYKLLP